MLVTLLESSVISYKLESFLTLWTRLENRLVFAITGWLSHEIQWTFIYQFFFQPWGLHRTGLTSFSPSYFTTRFFTEQFIRSLIKTFWPGSMTIGCYNMIWVIRGQLSHQMLVFRFLWAKNVSKTVTDINVCRFASAFNSVMCIISFSAYFQFL